METEIKIESKDEEIESKLEDLHQSIDIKDEILEYQPETSWKPEIRDDKFELREIQKVFIVTHEKGKPFACEICDFKSTYNSTLQRHLQSHAAKAKKQFKCVICDFKSATKGGMTIHLRSHSTKKQFECEYCDFKSARKGHLTIHLRTHSDTNPLKFS